MGWRADGEKVDHHQLAVMVPTSGDEAGLGPPAHGKRLAAIEHPWPIDTVIELRGEVCDRVVVEVGAYGKDAAKQDGRVDGGHFAVDERLAGLDVVEVVEEAVLVWHLVEVELQGGERLFF